MLEALNGRRRQNFLIVGIIFCTLIMQSIVLNGLIDHLAIDVYCFSLIIRLSKEMGITTYISASWTLNGNKEIFEMGEYGRRGLRQLEFFFDIDELYPGEYVSEDSDETPEEMWNLDETRDAFIRVTQKTCERAFSFILSYIKVFQEFYPSTLEGDGYKYDLKIYDELIQSYPEKLQRFSDHYNKNKQDLITYPLEESIRDTFYYYKMGRALEFTKTIYEKALIGAQDIRIFVSAF